MRSTVEVLKLVQKVLFSLSKAQFKNSDVSSQVLAYVEERVIPMCVKRKDKQKISMQMERINAESACMSFQQYFLPV